MKQKNLKKICSPVIITGVIFFMLCVVCIGARAASVPIIDSQPADITVYAGTPVTLSITAEGSGSLSYQWYSNSKNNSTGGVKVTGATSASFSPSAGIAKTTYYYCVVSLSDTQITSITSGVAAVTVKELPKITSQPSTATTYVGGIVKLTLKATGSGVLSYQWYVNTKSGADGAAAIPNETGSTLTVPTDEAGTNYYYCVVTNTDSSISGDATATAKSSTVKVLVAEATYIPKITLQPSPLSVYAGVNAKLRISALGSGTLKYQWYSNSLSSVSGSSEISGATSAVYSPSTAADGTIYYYCVVTNTVATTAGIQSYTATSDIVACKVNTGVNISVQPISSAVYSGANVLLSVSATGNGTLKYQWYVNSVSSTTGGQAVSGAVLNRYTPPTASTGTLYYYCGITNAASSNTDASTTYTSIASVKTVDLPRITTQPIGASVNAGDAVKLSIEASGSGTLTYQWYTNTRNCSSGGSKISGGTDSSYIPPTKEAHTTYYYCVVTNTDNSLTGARTSGATSDSVAVVINAVDVSAPTITKNPTSIFAVEGDTISLSLTVAGSGTLAYQWYRSTKRSVSDASAMTGEISSTLTVPTDTLGTAYYYCVVTNTVSSMPGIKSASAQSNITAVTVYPIAPTISQQPLSQVVYCGSSAYLSIKASSSGVLSYQWYCNSSDDNTTGTAITGAISSKYTVPTTDIGTTYYYCILTNTIKKTVGEVSGSLSSSVCSIVVAGGPSFSTQPAAATINSGEGFTLDVEASSSGALSYQWYQSTTDKNYGGALIKGATSAEYKLSTAVSSVSTTTYYYCIVTSTDSGVSNGKSITKASDTAKVTVLAVNAAAPKITSNPVSQSVKVGASTVLTVEADASGTLSYQWYSNSKCSTIGALAINSATDSSYTVTQSSAGVYYYYCVVTNTDSSLAGTKTASITSRIVKISATA